MSKLKRVKEKSDEMAKGDAPDISLTVPDEIEAQNLDDNRTDESSTERESESQSDELERLPESDDATDARAQAGSDELSDESTDDASESTDERQPAEMNTSQEDERQPAENESSDIAQAHGDDVQEDDARPASDASQPAESDPENPLIKICVSTQRPCKQSKRWKNVEMRFSKLCDKLSHPIETGESFYDYQNSDKKDRDQIKDQGGFVGGYLADEKKNRSIANMAARTLFTTDIDECTPEVFEAIESMLDYRASIDTSHSHSKENPRFRITAPLNRECSVDEYRLMAIQLNRELRDCMTEFQLEFSGVTEISDLEKLSFPDKEVIKDAARIIFWTSKSVDGEFIHKETHKPVIDVDAVLKRYRGEIHDAEKQRKISRSDSIHDAFAEFDAKNKNYPDPRVMDGIEGIFNRTYSLPDVLRIFLKDVYNPTSDPNRYTYKNGTSEKGLVLKDNYCAFSHHATDPANNGKPLSPFWILCIHKYGGDKKAACRALRRDKGVLAQIAKERIAEKKVQSIRDQFPLEKNEWLQDLKTNDKGEYASCASNCSLILESDPLFANIAKNEMSGRVEITGSVPWIRKMPDSKRKRKDIFARAPKQWLNEDDRAAMLVLLDKFYAPFTPWMLDYALRDVAAKRRFHPMRDFIENLPEWDGTDRITDLLPKAFNAKSCDYTAATIRKVLCAMIAKAYDPYIEFQYILVLDGKQGIGKSSFLRWIVGDRFFMSSLTLGDMQSKAAMEKIQDYAAAEIPEFGGMRKADQEIVKGFITSYSDVFRAAYAHDVIEKPRGCILLGTVNGERGTLKDITGGRRWWFVKCFFEHGRIWDKMFDENYRLQIWAQALAYYDKGEKLFMDTPELERAAFEAQRDAMEVDDRRGLIERYLEMKFPEKRIWEQKSIEDMREYSKYENHFDGKHLRDEICALEIYQVVFGGDVLKGDRKAQNEIALNMKSLPNWEYVDKPKNIPPFGKQRFYRRIKTDASQMTIDENSSIEAEPSIEMHSFSENLPIAQHPIAQNPIAHAEPVRPFVRNASDIPVNEPAAVQSFEISCDGFENKKARDFALLNYAVDFLANNGYARDAREIMQQFSMSDISEGKNPRLIDCIELIDPVCHADAFDELSAILPAHLRGEFRNGIDGLRASIPLKSFENFDSTQILNFEICSDGGMARDKELMERASRFLARNGFAHDVNLFLRKLNVENIQNLKSEDYFSLFKDCAEFVKSSDRISENLRDKFFESVLEVINKK